MSVLQNDSNLLQKRDNSKILPAIIVALVLVIACMYPIPVICAALVGYFVWRFAEKTRLERENAARCAGMKYILGPHLVSSIDTMESAESVYARAKQFKQDMIDSGNPYAHLIPVIPYPYSPMMYGPAQFNGSWNRYIVEYGAAVYQANQDWIAQCPAEILPTFLSQVIPAPTQQAI
jgi:hypothetical protein